MPLNIVLYQPEIPQNTGNIARTCAVTGSKLHLIKPLGFSIDDKHLKRAGLDYWHLLDIEIHENFNDFISKYQEGEYYLLTTRGDKLYTEINYSSDSFLIFGKETAGVPEEIHEKFKGNRIKIPMVKETAARSLNLSNSVAIVVYEALRQLGFPNLF